MEKGNENKSVKESFSSYRVKKGETFTWPRWGGTRVAVVIGDCKRK